MKTARDIFSELRIKERPGRGGSFVTTCPQCSHLRKKKTVPCLSVRVDDLGVRYFCHHFPCDFQGGQYFAGGSDTRPIGRQGVGKTHVKPGPRRTLESQYR